MKREPVLLSGAVALALTSGCVRQEKTSGSLPQEIFVWQRVWNAQVDEAVRQAKTFSAGFAVLAAEIDLRNGEPKIVRPNVDYSPLKAVGLPLALAIRIDPFAGAFNEHAETIVNLAREVVATARDQHVDVAELQIDFDCGEWKLDGYEKWLAEIRNAVAPLAVTPTILPSWMKHRAFSKIARESGSFILQVHSVSLPENIEGLGKLTDPAQARAWVAQAARAGVPFRVSLPTYAYLVAFDAAGKACGISAEGPMPYWPREARIVRWQASADEMAELVSEWTRARPAALRGLFWYRLPVASDNLNWSWKTLAAVMQGRALKHALRIVAPTSQPNEIVARNEGDSDEALPAKISARWKNAKLIAADALDGYEIKESGKADTVTFARTTNAEGLRLRPDTERKIGWIRCEPPTKIEVSFASDTSPASDRFSSLPRHRN